MREFSDDRPSHLWERVVDTVTGAVAGLFQRRQYGLAGVRMGSGKKMNRYECARTKWKPSSRLRLRVCLECRNRFPSAGSESRFCPKCTRKLEDVRARMFTESPVRALLDELEDLFDTEMLARNQGRKKLDAIAREKRKRALGC